MKKKPIIISVLLFVLFLITQFGSNLKSSELIITEIPNDFKYDGCSMFPNGNYLQCCTTHDQQYFFGGNWRERLKSDLELSRCVQSKGSIGHDILGPAMFLGVRIGGAPLFPTPFRWGFGRDIYGNK